MVGRSLEGLALVHEGRVEDGMRRLDESAVAARAGDVNDLMWQSKVCCNLIAACERVGDVDRAMQWCDEVREFARAPGAAHAVQRLPTQYAAVLLQTGAWTEAEAELQRAIEVLSRGRRTALLDGTARLGELRRRQGRLDEARSLFAQAEATSVARIGAIELALDDGDSATALALAQRLERATRESRLLDRVGALALVARSAVAAGRLEVAGEASAALDDVAAAIGTNGARGTAAHAAGEYALARGELELAQRRLEDAVDAFGAHEAPYDRARARLVLARVLAALGPASRATAEARAARDDFAQPGRPPRRRPGRGAPGRRPAGRARRRGHADAAASARCSPSSPPAAPTARSPASWSSASTPCTATWRTSCASSASRPALRRLHAPRATAWCSPNGPSSTRWPIRPRPHGRAARTLLPATRRKESHATDSGQGRRERVLEGPEAGADRASDRRDGRGGGREHAPDHLGHDRGGSRAATGESPATR